MSIQKIMDINYFSDLVDVVFENVSNLNKILGISVEFIHLGGGIGIPYKPDQQQINIDKLAKVISDSILRNIELYDLNFVPKIIMENGRYITGPYGWLVSKCQSIKYGYDDKKFYGLDACMANLMRPGMYNWYHHISIPKYENIIDDDLENLLKSIENIEQQIYIKNKKTIDSNCGYCNTKFSTKSNLTRHLKLCKDKDKIIQYKTNIQDRLYKVIKKQTNDNLKKNKKDTLKNIKEEEMNSNIAPEYNELYYV